ncbi:Glyoxalase/Bleomycin resistance protein/Dioxygenase superfamily protein [Roseomonas rosea]|uniref:Glyoxalase/Bleomycin resistance protein/Dioxygenase superfamily protein n=1 Tax=Muricoccus roseus TaxID=198092 RepID=A0A1M6KFF9_9PROT|nr:VOC family protein [Roseomonas rosea]SHJ57602.1 Glyoxalase/Bleomycin resistance protein/Dioxygenase superfamily protein [Roseomonas rosea]
MTRFAFDHVHLRSPDPDVTGQWFEDHLEAKRVRRVEGPNSLRVILDLGGLNLFIDRVPAGTPSVPPAPFLGIEHLALAVKGIDALVEELRGKDVRIVMEPNNPNPTTRIAFIEGPENVRVELLERSAA